MHASATFVFASPKSHRLRDPVKLATQTKVLTVPLSSYEELVNMKVDY